MGYGYGPQWGMMGGYGYGYGLLHMVVWVVVLVAIIAGVIWLVRSLAGNGWRVLKPELHRANPNDADL